MRSFLVALFLAAILFASASTSALQQKPKLGPGRKYTTVERVQPEHLSAVNRDRLALARMRHEVGLKSGLVDYRAILHAHAEDATHTGGTRPEMLAAAKRVGVKVIMLTDHVRPQRDFINDSWRGIHEGVLFIPGAEAEGFLAYPQKSIKAEKFASRDAYISLIKRDGGSIFLSHVEERFDWPTDQLDGLEIYNNHTDIKDESGFLFWLSSALTDPTRLPQLQKALETYPQEFFSSSQDYLAPIIEKWDRDLLVHRSTGVAANDCHHNQGFTIKAAQDSVDIVELVGGEKPRNITVQQQPQIAELLRGKGPGDIIARLDIDPYERSMSFVTTHILAAQLSESAMREALRQSHAFVAHDWLTDSSGFAFVIRERQAKKNLAIMGDELKFRPGLTLEMEAPVKGSIRVFRDGKVIREVEGDRLSSSVDSPGVYRIEIWLSVDGESRPWIYSNAIRITS